MKLRMSNASTKQCVQSHLTIKPRCFELGTYGDRGAARHNGLRAQKVHRGGRKQVVLCQNTAGGKLKHFYLHAITF